MAEQFDLLSDEGNQASQQKLSELKDRLDKRKKRWFYGSFF